MGNALKEKTWQDLTKRNKRNYGFNNLTHIVFQRSLLHELLHLLHEHCEHFGIAKTFDRVQELFYRPGMRRDVHDWESSCKVCSQKKSPQQKHIHNLTTWKPNHPF